MTVNAALKGENVIITTGTASGKTLAFSIPVFNTLLYNPEARALFFYPTKALAGDQLKALEDIAENIGLGNKIFRFDGDVSNLNRKRALQQGRVLLCTPDVLHATMLRRNNDQEYNSFFKDLKFVVLDESHIYSGAFGSNMAFVMRRLNQVCQRKGALIQFIAASATSKDPGRHLELLTAQKFTVINEQANGSPSGGRRFIIAGNAEDKIADINNLIGLLTAENHGFIAFCHSRRLTEQYYNELIQKYPNLQGKIMPYRSGYELDDRQAIENALRTGDLCGVICTSALELGVDLPNLEYCLMLGLPPTAMSFWQRAGRVGRRLESEGKVLIFPADNPLDNYYLKYPQKLFERPVEDLAIHLDNKQLILSHFACARVESNDFDNPDFSEKIFGQDFVDMSDNIVNLDIVEDVLISNDPHSIVGIRCIGDPTYEIFTTGGEKRLGTINWSQVLREAYPEAVYRHMGEAYRVERIISRDLMIKVKRERKNASTSPVGYIIVKERSSGLGGTVFRKTIWSDKMEMYHTTVAVTTLTSGFKEKLNNSWVQKKYPTPLQRRVISEGVWIKFLPGFGDCKRDGLNAFVHALSNAYSIYMPCDISEIATHSVIRKQENCSVVFVFDTTAGGLGISSGVFDCFMELLPLVEERILQCDHCDPELFDRGCPSCIQIPRWFEDNEHLSKQAALTILDRIRRICREVEPQQSVSSAFLNRGRGGLTAIRDFTCNQVFNDEIDKKYGEVVYNSGSKVKMPSGLTGTVTNYFIEDESLFYLLVLADERRIRIRDMGLTLIEGEYKYLCMSCGNEYLEKRNLCDNCNAELF